MYLVPEKDRFVIAGLFVFYKEVCDVYIKYNPLCAVIQGKKTKKYYYQQRSHSLLVCKAALRKELVRLLNLVPCGGEKMLSSKIRKKITNVTLKRMVKTTDE